jgi:nucleotide-binding universal stress UspA family protein
MFEVKTILVTTDLSPGSAKAAAPAETLAAKLGAKLILLHVFEPFLPGSGHPVMPIDVDVVNQGSRERATRELEKLAGEHFRSKPETVVLQGSPRTEIVEFARERGVDLIVMATHGRGFVSHAILGSTTERVLRRAPCAVLVVRDEKPE